MLVVVVVSALFFSELFCHTHCPNSPVLPLSGTNVDHPLVEIVTIVVVIVAMVAVKRDVIEESIDHCSCTYLA